MVDSDDVKPAEDDGSSGLEPDESSGEDLEVYDVSEEESGGEEAGTPAGEAAQAGERWFFAAGGGAQQGPVVFAVLQEKAAAGELAREDLVWREGMPKWKRAGNVAGLFAEATAEPGPRPPRLPEKTASRPAETTATRLPDVLEMLRRWPGSSGSLRLCGYGAAGLAVITLVVSVLLWYWGRTWFTGAVLFLLAFLVCQGMAAILDAVNRLAREIFTSGGPKDDGSG